MPIWRKLFHVVYAPSDVCKNMLLEGTKDMLTLLASGQNDLNGITIIKPELPLEKRDFSYQLLPGTEHLHRLLSGKNII